MSFQEMKRKAENSWKNVTKDWNEEDWKRFIDDVKNLGIDIDKSVIGTFHEYGVLKREKLFNLGQQLDIPINQRIPKSNNESTIISEDMKHWWELVKTEAFPTLAFYPALQVWLEIDKYIKGSDYNTKVMMFYASLWLVLVSGKYIAGWMKWKKEKPDEYELERSMGKGGLI